MDNIDNSPLLLRDTLDTNQKRYHSTEIHWKSNSFHTSKYSVVNDNDNVEELARFVMQNIWKISSPNLVMSVAGPAKDIPLSNKLETAFKLNLMKIADSSDSCMIITGSENFIFI